MHITSSSDLFLSDRRLMAMLCSLFYIVVQCDTVGAMSLDAMQEIRSTVMKRLIHCLLFLLGFCSPAYAAQGVVKGNVQYVRTHAAAYISEWAPPMFWFSLKGVSSAGACQGWNGSVLFVANDKSTYALILAAQTTGQEIEVSFDDAIKLNGWCAGLHFTIGNPAPLY